MLNDFFFFCFFFSSRRRHTRFDCDWSSDVCSSDLFVKTPAGEIPWSKLSRLSDEEMKTLMIDVVNRTYLLLRTLFDEDVDSYLIRTLSQQDLVPRWHDPQ